MKTTRLTVAAIVCCMVFRNNFVAAEDLVVAAESFAYRGTYPLELELLGRPGAGWKSSWRRWGDLPPVFVDSHTINNPFGSGHGSSERASNQSGQLRASQRILCESLGENGTRATVEFAMMEYTAANQDGNCGGLQLLQEGARSCSVAVRSTPRILPSGRPTMLRNQVCGRRHSSPPSRVNSTALTSFAWLSNTARRPTRHDLSPTVCTDCRLPRRWCIRPRTCRSTPSRLCSMTIRWMKLSCDARPLPTSLRCTIVRCVLDAWPTRFRSTGKGEYHIFYLRAVGKVPWEHVVSRDLVHWRECPTALVADGDATSADGLNMFTGSVIEHEGRFHMFYVGWNPNNPDGREFIMHAVSDDLMEWKKLPDDRLGPDGQRYSNVRERDFRDPFVVRDEQADKFWMFLVHGSRHRSCLVARSATLGIRRAAAIELRRSGYTGVSGHLHDRRSHLPDRFADQYQEHHRPSRKADWRSPFEDVVGTAIDTPFLYAAKRMYDGQRHVITGWIRDLEGQRDDGNFLWGGTQCVPREVYVGSDPHELCFRPVPEAVAQYPHARVDLGSSRDAIRSDRQWTWGSDSRLVGASTNGAACVEIDAPSNYLLTCTLTPSEDAQVNLVFRTRRRCGEDSTKLAVDAIRETSEESPTGYTLHLESNHAELRGRYFRSGRSIVLPLGQPVTVTALVQGTLVECFVNDAYAFSCRAYDFRAGSLVIELTHGSASIHELKLRTHEL